MKIIPLTRNKIASVDDEDYNWLIQWKWTYCTSGYAIRAKILKNKKYIRYYMHREIMNYRVGIPENKIIDHIDRNKLNNTKNNLRACTYSQNMINRNPYGTSKYMGVSLHPQTKNRWIAKIVSNKKQIHVGSFISEIEAAKAYDIKAKEIHGEFANINFK